MAIYRVLPEDHGANSPSQILGVLAPNRMKSFQIASSARQRFRSRKRRTAYLFLTIQSLRYRWPSSAGRLIHQDGHPTLNVGRGPAVRRQFRLINDRLSRIA